MSARPSRSSSAGGPRSSRTSRSWSPTTTRSRTASWSGDARRRVPLRRDGVGKGTRVGRAHAERHVVAGRGDRAPAGRRDPRAAEHVPPSAGARGPAPHRRRRAPRAWCRTFLARDYLADLAAISPALVPGTRPRRRRVAAARGRSRCGTVIGRVVTPTTTAAPGAGRRAGRGGPAGRRPRRHLHLRQPRRPEGCDPHPRRRARCHRGRTRGPSPRASTTGSTSRCPSSGSAGSAPACCRRWSPGPRCSPRRARSRSARLPFLERERVTLFRGWPEQAAALAARPAVRRRRPRLAAAGQPRRRPARRRCRPHRRPGRTCSA